MDKIFTEAKLTVDRGWGRRQRRRGSLFVFGIQPQRITEAVAPALFGQGVVCLARRHSRRTLRKFTLTQ